MTNTAGAEPVGQARSVADWLHLAATPVFALMAAVTGLPQSAPMEVLCGTSPLGGMAVMYLLMSAFHAAPWLKLALRRTGL